ncbi:MAG: tetratricopeptide repeat protein [Elusimicrobiota bacterium]|nr:tetratricopeptide repeat protein [Elusimicrobiota bacterium]
MNSIEAGKYTNALMSLQIAINNNPDEELYHRQHKKLSRILEIVDKVEGEEPLKVHIRKSIAAYFSDDIKSAFNYVLYAIFKAPQETTAIKFYSSLKKQYPEIAELQVEPGTDLVNTKLNVQYITAYKNKDFQTATRLCKDVIELEPENYLAYLRLGSAYYQLGDKEKALAAWQKAIKLEPSVKTQIEPYLREIEK